MPWAAPCKNEAICAVRWCPTVATVRTVTQLLFCKSTEGARQTGLCCQGNSCVQSGKQTCGARGGGGLAAHRVYRLLFKLQCTVIVKEHVVDSLLLMLFTVVFNWLDVWFHYRKCVLSQSGSCDFINFVIPLGLYWFTFTFMLFFGGNNCAILCRIKGLLY